MVTTVRKKKIRTAVSSNNRKGFCSLEGGKGWSYRVGPRGIGTSENAKGTPQGVGFRGVHKSQNKRPFMLLRRRMRRGRGERLRGNIEEGAAEIGWDRISRWPRDVDGSKGEKEQKRNGGRIRVKRVSSRAQQSRKKGRGDRGWTQNTMLAALSNKGLEKTRASL